MRMSTAEFTGAANALGKNAARQLAQVPDEIKASAQEIRMRINQPTCISLSDGRYVLEKMITTEEDIENVFLELCGYSVYSCQNELLGGFITAPGGHRAGFGCSAVYKKGELTGIRDITSINMRIAREIIGCADGLCRELFAGGLRGVLIVGSPSSGKTTLLRDISRFLSDGSIGKYTKVTLADERGELSAVSRGKPGMNVGCCDVLYGYEKSTAMLQAVRCLSPQVIICDEIGSVDDAKALTGCVNAGVKVISSVHAANMEELLARRHIMDLLDTGAFEKVAFLKGSDSPAQISKVVEINELYKNLRSIDDDCVRSAGRQ